MKIIMSDVSVYNTLPDFRPDFRRKKCVLYAAGKITAYNVNPWKVACFTLKKKLDFILNI